MLHKKLPMKIAGFDASPLMLSVGSDSAHTGAQSSFNMVRNNNALLCVVVSHTDDDAERR